MYTHYMLTVNKCEPPRNITPRKWSTAPDTLHCSKGSSCSNLPQRSIKIASQGLCFASQQTKAHILFGVDAQQQIGDLCYTNLPLLLGNTKQLCNAGHIKGAILSYWNNNVLYSTVYAMLEKPG